MVADLFADPAGAVARVYHDVDRSQFLGGSDAAAVMGLSPWATPVELWQQKTGRAPAPKVTQARQRMFDRGHKLEPFIRDMVIDKLRDQGLDVELLASNQRYTDPEHEFLRAEIDFELLLRGSAVIGSKIVEFKGEHINCDAKSVSGFARQKWGDVDTEDVPIEYAAQFMLQPPRPPHWGGYRLVPDEWQFWQGRKSRLHDRLRYRLDAGQWLRERLAP